MKNIYSVIIILIILLGCNSNKKPTEIINSETEETANERQENLMEETDEMAIENQENIEIRLIGEEEGVLKIKSQKFTPNQIQKLETSFRKNSILDKRSVAFLYTNDYEQVIKEWYKESEPDDDFGIALGDNIFPKEIIESGGFKFYVFSMEYNLSTPDGGYYEGEKVFIRLMSKNEWKSEMNYIIGQDFSGVYGGPNDKGKYRMNFQEESIELTTERIHPLPTLSIFWEGNTIYPEYFGQKDEIITETFLFDTTGIFFENISTEENEKYGIDNKIFEKVLEDKSADYFINLLPETDLDIKVKEFFIKTLNDTLRAVGVDITEDVPESLLIIGNDIWVREIPSTGKVVMKLNDGDLCEVLEKGKYEEIRGMKDYWYKIRFNEKEGWVFGSQTSIKLVNK